MIDNDQILVRMDEGFSKLHERLNAISTESSFRQLGCAGRMAAIEKDIAVRSALNGVNEIEKGHKVNFQSYLARTAWGTIIVGVLIVIWKIFLGNINLVIK